MRASSATAIALAVSAFAITSAPIPVSSQQPAVQRKVLLTQDLPIPGYQTVMVAVEIPVGGREGRR